MYKNILKPIEIRGIKIPNRFVMTAMLNNCSKDGDPTDETVAYFEARAKGGWGIITTDLAAPTATGGSSFKNALSLESDERIDTHKRLTEAVHKYDSKIVVQLGHGGMVAKRGVTGVQPMSPSPVKDLTMPEMAREMTTEDIELLIEQFGDAAVRAKKAGYDGVELHGGNRYLIFAFLSPLINKRTDKYGGSIINRTRFAVEIVENIRKKAGEDFLIIFKLSVVDGVDGGQSVAESKVVAKLLERAGVDIICCGQGGSKSRNIWISAYETPKGTYIENTAAIKSVVNIPVMANGKIVDPEMGDIYIEEGKTDFIAMGRASLADPDMPIKLARGEAEKVFRCIGCHQGCIGELDKLHRIKCLVNPTTNNETLPIVTVEKPKTIWVAGGGVAGCEAAIWAAKRGHNVVLYEKDSILGGQWRAACVPLGKADFAEVINRQRILLAENNVEIVLNKELTADEILAGNPDALILANGSKPIIPPIKGMDSITPAIAKDILLGKTEIINNTVEKTDQVVHAITAKGGGNLVVIGGGSVGAETAEYLALHGNRVTLVEMKPEIASDAEGIPRKHLLDMLNKFGVNIITNAMVEEVTAHSVQYSVNNEKNILNDVDMIILACGVKPDTSLKDALVEYKGELYSIGDADSQGNGFNAIQAGFSLGMRI